MRLRGRAERSGHGPGRSLPQSGYLYEGRTTSNTKVEKKGKEGRKKEKMKERKEKRKKERKKGRKSYRKEREEKNRKKEERKKAVLCSSLNPT